MFIFGRGERGEMGTRGRAQKGRGGGGKKERTVRAHFTFFSARKGKRRGGGKGDFPTAQASPKRGEGKKNRHKCYEERGEKILCKEGEKEMRSPSSIILV